jgi:hypothetical protein
MYNAALNRRTITTNFQLTLDTVSWLGLSKHVNAKLRRVVRTSSEKAGYIEYLVREEVINNGGDPCRWTAFIRDLV